MKFLAYHDETRMLFEPDFINKDGFAVGLAFNGVTIMSRVILRDSGLSEGRSGRYYSSRAVLRPRAAGN